MTQAQTYEPGQVRILQDARGRRTTYEELEIGKDLGSAEFVVTQAQIDQTCERMGDHHPFYEVDSPFGGTVAPIYLTYKLTRMLFSQTYSVRGLFYKWAFEFINPIRTNVAYTVSARLTEKWIKNDREFVAYESICTDPQGNTVFTTRRAHVLDYIKRTAPKVGVNGMDTSDARTPAGKAAREPFWEPDWPDEDTAAGTGKIDVVPLAGTDTRLRTPLPSFSLYLSREQFRRHWGWADRRQDANRTLHIEPEAARQEGLPAPVAGGPDIMALTHRSALHFLGTGWLKGGKADLTVARPTFPGDYVTSKGFVKGIELTADGSLRLTCDVWVESQTGEKKVVGTLSGLVPAR